LLIHVLKAITLYTNKGISNNMLTNSQFKKMIWLGDFDPKTREWVKVNRKLETDPTISQEECEERKFIWLEGRCFAVKSYNVHRITYGAKYAMNEMDDVFVLRQYYAILK